MLCKDEREAADFIRRVSEYELISGILWVVIALLQMCTCWLAIAGIWNICMAVMRFLMIERIKSRDQKIPGECVGLGLLIATGVINLLLGGIIGVALTAFDYYIRNQILENRHLFNGSICAAPTKSERGNEATPQRQAMDETAMDLLARLATLHQKGALSDEEFDAMKQSLLNKTVGSSTKAPSSNGDSTGGASAFGNNLNGEGAVASRIALLVVANFAIMATLFIICAVLSAIFGLSIEEGAALSFCSIVFAAIIGFGGSFLSLAISKRMAKALYKIKVIDTPSNSTEAKLMEIVRAHSTAAGIIMPEVGIYESEEVNAFATGMSKNSSLVAVSSSLLAQMDDSQLKGVTAHEIGHIANGDMVTMTLLQGVMNTFVICLSSAIVTMLRGFLDEKIAAIVCAIARVILNLTLSFIASLIVLAYSRWREYRADAASVAFCGDAQPMLSALVKLQELSIAENAIDDRCASLATFKISGSDLGALLSTHPPLEERIEAVKRLGGNASLLQPKMKSNLPQTQKPAA